MLALAATALAAVVAVGIDMRLSLGMLALWGATAAVAVLARARARVQRTVVASASALAVSFGGAALQQQLPLGPPIQRGVGPVASAADHRDYRTAVVAGFPFQRIEGHGAGGAPDYLPWRKGLGWLLVNGLLGAALGCGCARALARMRRRIRGTTWTANRRLACAALLAAAPLALHGWWELVKLVD